MPHSVSAIIYEVKYNPLILLHKHCNETFDQFEEIKQSLVDILWKTMYKLLFTFRFFEKV